MPKFIQLLSIEHCKSLKNLSVFVEKAFQLRKDTILLEEVIDINVSTQGY